MMDELKIVIINLLNIDVVVKEIVDENNDVKVEVGIKIWYVILMDKIVLLDEQLLMVVIISLFIQDEIIGVFANVIVIVI